MKCTKCGEEFSIGGSDLNGNVVCHVCQLKQLRDLELGPGPSYAVLHARAATETQLQLSTAEMLLWIVENRKAPVIFNASNFFTICGKPKDRYYSYGSEGDRYKTFSEAVAVAYEEVRGQE